MHACMLVHMYICMHTHTYTFTHTHINTYIHTHTHTHACVHMHTHTHTHTHTYENLSICHVFDSDIRSATTPRKHCCASIAILLVFTSFLTETYVCQQLKRNTFLLFHSNNGCMNVPQFTSYAVMAWTFVWPGAKFCVVLGHKHSN